MTATERRRSTGREQLRTAMVQQQLSAMPPHVSPWSTNDLVLPTAPHYGRYGDLVWRYGKQAPNQSDHFCDVSWSTGADATWPNDQWVQVGRDFGMAMQGRKPGRAALVAGASKPITVHQDLVTLGVIARWAEQTGAGLPDGWDETIGLRLLDDVRAGRMPVRATNLPITKAPYRFLNVVGKLWLHRSQIAHGPTAQPWPDFATTSAKELARGGVRSALMPAVSTDVVEPAVWWALVRFAMRFVFVYGPDLLAAWPVYLERGREGCAGRRTGAAIGPRTVALLEAFAAVATNFVPVGANGAVNLYQLWPLAGVRDIAFRAPNVYAGRCWEIVDRMVADGRTTRFWFGGVSNVPLQDGSRGPWVNHLDCTNIVTLITRLRDACYILITALGALRDSETQGLRRGCVTIADGGYALTGEIVKGKDIPEPARWWVDPIVSRCVTTLEQLSAGVPVTDMVAGERVASNRLLWSTSYRMWGKAGIGAGSDALAETIKWINENADTFDLPRARDDRSEPAIPMTVTPQQLRVTFAAVAAMEPEGPLGVSEQLHDTFAVAASYMANPDSKWFDVYREHREKATVARLRGYLNGGLDVLCGPGAAGVVADLHVVEDEAVDLAGEDDYASLVDELLRAAGRTFGTSNLSHCRGRAADARCSTVFGGLRPDQPFTPNFEADVCFGRTVADDCRNVVYDPPDHLPVWDIALAAYQAELTSLPQSRELARVELQRLIAAAQSRIAAMEQACEGHLRPLLDRMLSDLERYLDYIRFDTDIPGAAAQYRHLFLATRARILWVRDRMPAQDRPDWSLPAADRLDSIGVPQ
ncbi:hypothetical protein [Streptomyces sp. NPDC000994]